jgi:hypothetical protein
MDMEPVSQMLSLDFHSSYVMAQASMPAEVSLRHSIVNTSLIFA